MNVSEFFQEFFINGWNHPETYNIFDTLAYALLAILIVYFSYKLLKQLKINFDYKTALSIIPFITLGAIIRILADKGVYPRFFWTVTPGVWIIFFTLSIITLLLDNKFRTNYKITIITPLVFIIPYLFMMNVVNPEAIVLFIIFYALSLMPFLLLRRKYALFKDNFNFAIIASHFFDATSSFVNVDFFNYSEIHVLGGFFAGMFNTGFVMYFLKIIVLLPVLYYVDKDKSDKKFNNYLKLIIFALGFGPGIRNLITVLLGV